MLYLLAEFMKLRRLYLEVINIFIEDDEIFQMYQAKIVALDEKIQKKRRNLKQKYHTRLSKIDGFQHKPFKPEMLSWD
tara:strand:+ start:1585 stop:1818 length:234 start_codon:yes stop_codon:yes gene_type:complete